MNIVIVGHGNMGKAFMGQWSSENIVCVDPFKEGCLSSLEEIPFLREGKSVDLLMLAIKPQSMTSFLNSAKDVITQMVPQVVVTIAASLPLKFYEPYISQKSLLVRLMPNLAVHYGLGVTGIYTKAPSIPKDIICLLEKTGDLIYLKDEDLLDALTPFSGSGPGFIFSFMEAFQSELLAYGFSEGDSQKILLKTIQGSVELLKQTGKSPALLKQQVASPKGITEAGLQVFQDPKNGIASLLERTLKACFLRNEVLKKN